MAGVVALFVLTGAQATSFDCAKARSEVEKLVCHTPKLSALDEDVARQYQSALKTAPDAMALRGEQLRWLRHRDFCRNASCLAIMYKMRLDELEATAWLGKEKAKTRVRWKSSEKPNFNRESEKLAFIRSLVSAELGREFDDVNPDPQVCRQLVKDVLTGANVKVIEPMFVTEDPNDDRFAKYEWCKDQPGSPGPEPFRDIYLHVGGPPYRYYQLELDGNLSNGKEDVLATDYVPYDDEGNFGGHNGFFWVDATVCETKGGAVASPGYGLKILPPNVYRQSVLVEYHGNYYGLFFLPYLSQVGLNKAPVKYLLEIQRIGGAREPGRACGATLNPK